MLNWSEQRLLTTLGIATAIVMEPVSWLTSGPSPCIVNPANYGDYYAESNICPTFHVFLFKILAAIFEKLGEPNWVIATFTIVLAASNIGLWLSTNKLWRSADDNMRVLERAYLGVGPTQIKIVEPEGETPRHVHVGTTIDNVGKTAAFITKIYGEFSFTPPNGDVPVYEHGAGTRVDFVIAGNTNCPLTPVNFNTRFVEPQFFWGYIEFMDIFRRPHIARSCTVIYPATATFDLAGSPAWNGWD
jgi:hypothetical protein